MVPWVGLQCVIVVFLEHTQSFVEVHWVILHSKYQGSIPCGFTQKGLLMLSLL